ncbi:MAG: S8 family serine peptidase [Synechococcales cyanobacterium T60_A2020_003]|nr:S8 family serine peptidase [Synechococcales cyanobacterium T60_A2020_003]
MNTSMSLVGMSQSLDRLLDQPCARFQSSRSYSESLLDSVDSPSQRQSFQRSAAVDSRSLAQQERVRLAANDVYKGKLGKGDRLHPNRQNRRVDLFALGRVKSGESVEISLVSTAFDPVLELIDRRTKQVVQSNDDRSKGDRNSYIRFETENRARYQIQVTSFDREATGRYRLKVTTGDNVASTVFDYKSGYGLVDAAAAVAAALKRAPFASLPNTSDLWGLDAINAPEAWAEGFTGKDVIVAVLDTGVNYNHKDLKDNIWKNPGEIAGNGIDDDKNGFIDDVRGWKFVDTDSNNPMDLDGHGTHVSGTIAAMNNDFGVTGVAYNAKIMPVKVIDGRDDNSTQKFDQNLAAGIRYAVDNGARVLNMSLGAYIGEPTLQATQRALQYAYRKGAIAVMAAGNNGAIPGVDSPIEPAAFALDNLGIAVGAIRENYDLARFSNPAGKTPLPFVVGPGVKVKSTVLQNGYDSYSGTSMASPHVAGVVALMLSANPNLTPDQVRQILIETANPEGVKTA